MIPLRLEDGLVEYDPYQDELGERLWDKVGTVVRPALLFVRKYSIEELRQAMEQLTPLLDQAHQRANAFLLDNALDPIKSTYFYTDLQSDIWCLFCFRKDIESEKHRITLTWPELFAAIALSYIGILYSRENHGEISSDELERRFEERKFKVLAHREDSVQREAAAGRILSYQLLIDNAPMFAMEALGIARTMGIEELSQAAHIKRLSKVNRNRNEKYLASRRWVFEMYQEIYDRYYATGNSISRRKAAQQIEEWAPDWVFDPLTTSDPADTFASWIKNYTEGNLMGVEDIPPFNPRPTWET